MKTPARLIAFVAAFSGVVAAQEPPSGDRVLEAMRASRAAVPEARITYTRTMVAQAKDVVLREHDEGELLVSPRELALRVVSSGRGADGEAAREVIWLSRQNRLISVDTGTVFSDPDYHIGSIFDGPKSHLGSSDCILNIWYYRRGLPIHEFIAGALSLESRTLTTSRPYPAPREQVVRLQMRIEDGAGELRSLAEMDIDPSRGMLVESQRRFRVVDGELEQPPYTEVRAVKAEQMGGSGVWFPTEVTMRAGLAEVRFVVSDMRVGEGEFDKGLAEMLTRPVIVSGPDDGEYYLLDRRGGLTEGRGEAAGQKLLDEYRGGAPD